MRILVVSLAALIATGCAYQPPFTEPTPIAQVVAAPAPRIARFEVFPQVDPLGRTVTLLLTVWDEVGSVGALSPNIDASCTATSGVVNPQRIVGKRSVVATWSNALPLRGVVTCRTAGFERDAVAAVDLSAWSIRFGGFREELDERLQWRTLATFTQEARSTYPAIMRTIQWGDGQTEILSGHMPASSAIQNVSHVYQRGGEYLVVGRVEWAFGGSTETRAILTRKCEAFPPGSTTVPATTVNFGYCSNTFREVQ